MNDTLKAARRIGAELGAAKAENDRLREVLSRIANLPMYQCSTENDYRLSAAKAMAVAALSQQAEPVRCPGTEDTASMDSDSAQEQYTAVDMATAAAQGFRDGQAAAEQATAQDERTAFEAWFLSKWPANQLYRRDALPASDQRYDEYCNPHVRHAYEGWLGRAARPAQTEQQPEQSWLVEAALHKAVAYLDENPFNEIASGSILHRVMGAALSTTPIPAMAAKEA